MEAEPPSMHHLLSGGLAPGANRTELTLKNGSVLSVPGSPARRLSQAGGVSVGVVLQMKRYAEYEQ